MHADTLDIDLAIREFEEALGQLFEPHRRDMTLLQSRIVEAVKNHKPVGELHRRLVLLRALELAGA